MASAHQTTQFSTTDNSTRTAEIETIILALRQQHILSPKCPGCDGGSRAACDLPDHVDKASLIRALKSACNDQLDQPTKKTPLRPSMSHFERIDDASRLQVGDHIFFHRVSGYSHHSIVTRQDSVKEELAVVEYAASWSQRKLEVRNKEQRKSYGQRSCSCVGFCGGSLYRVDYDDCYSNNHASEEAQKAVDKQAPNYCILTRNCEHTSHWFKTGRSDSKQVATCFFSVGKMALSIFLRFLGLIALWVREFVHETEYDSTVNPEERKRLERFARILNSIYVLVISLLLLGYFLKHECRKIKPLDETVNPDESSCACVACVKGQRRRGCCGRPSVAVFRLFIRICLRELIAALGPFAVMWFEDEIHESGHTYFWSSLMLKFALLVFISCVSYVGGALIGSFCEELFELFRKLCCFESKDRWKDKFVTVNPENSTSASPKNQPQQVESLGPTSRNNSPKKRESLSLSSIENQPTSANQAATLSSAECTNG